MDCMVRWTKVKYCLVSCVLVCVLVGGVIAEEVDVIESIKTESQEELQAKAKQEVAEKARRAAEKISDAEIAALDLPNDTSAVMSAEELRITGNSLIATEELLSGIPSIYNDSDLPVR